MNFENLYVKLPNSIKYNKNIFKFFTGIAAILRKAAAMKNRNQLVDTHHELLNLLITSCEIKTKGTQRNIQLLYVELLKFVDNVCNKYDIDYYISDGTLLGAYRHGGFIPWDDDVDICMMREDYNKLIEILPNEIEKYPILKENCSLTLLKEYDKNYFKNFKSVYDQDHNNASTTRYKLYFLQFAWLKPFIKIDVFPKDFINPDKLDFLKDNYSVEKFKFFDELHNRNIKDLSTSFKEKKDKLGFVDYETEYFIDAFDSSSVNTFKPYKTNEVFPLKSIKFEDYYFKCPNNVEYVLEILFGKNFRNIPNNLEHHEVRKLIEYQFNSKEEMDKSFKESIEILKEINDKYK